MGPRDSLARCSTDRGMPNSAAARRTLRWAVRSRSLLGMARGFCPRRRPLALARASPARTRSAILARSNSAIAARMCICSLPAGVVASMPSCKLTKATPRACSSSSNVIRWRRFRPSRSNRQQTRTSNRRRRASVTRASRAGRRSLAPLTPRCVQRRLVCSVGVSPTGVRARGPVAWIAVRRETDWSEAYRQSHHKGW